MAMGQAVFSNTAGDPIGLKLYGDALFAESDISGAINLWSTALHLAEMAPLESVELVHEVRMKLVQCHTRRGEWECVLSHCEAVIASAVEDLKAYYWRTIALMRLQKFEEMKSALLGYEAHGGQASTIARIKSECARKGCAIAPTAAKQNNDELTAGSVASHCPFSGKSGVCPLRGGYLASTTATDMASIETSSEALIPSSVCYPVSGTTGMCKIGSSAAAVLHGENDAAAASMPSSGDADAFHGNRIVSF